MAIGDDQPADAVGRARALRRQQTDAERRLWSRLRRRGLGGRKFRRQMPIGPYIVDFACPSERLVIEVDGGQHGEAIERDAERDAWMQARGWRVMRFWNNQVLGETEAVLETILSTFGLPPSSLPPQAGGG